MLSGLTDKLRERAKALRQGHWSDGRDDALLMEDAADTIDRLNCLYFDLVRAFGRLKDENAKLRELASIFDRCMGTPDCKTCQHYHANGGSVGWNCRLDQLQEELGLLDGDA